MRVLWQLSNQNLKLKLGLVLETKVSQDSDLTIIITTKEIFIFSILKIFQQEIYIQHYSALKQVFERKNKYESISRKVFEYYFLFI